MDENSIHDEYTGLVELREGATFAKMDLHTHSPASECSTFEMPTKTQAFFDRLGDLSDAKRVAELERLGSGQSKVPWEDTQAAWKVGRREPPAQADVQAIVAAWTKEMPSVPDDATAEVKAQAKEERTRLAKLALRDVERFFAASYWPEEFVMRCYIEGLQLVALTDHNHPGYVVPRLARLGNWYTRLTEVNNAWHQELAESGGPERLRTKILARLDEAARRLRGGDPAQRRGDDEVQRNHDGDVPKQLSREDGARLERVNALIAFWKDDTNPVRGLWLLPGTEVTVSNVHVLTIYPPQWYVPSRIASMLLQVGIPEEDWGRGFSAAASASVQDLIELVDGLGGIAIPAHSNSDHKGLLRLFRSGLALQKVLEHPATVALEVTGGSIYIGKAKRGKNPFKTLEFFQSKGYKPIALVKNSDAHECRIDYDGVGEDLGVRYTNVKLDLRPSDTNAEVFRALRLVLSTGWNRVVEHPVADSYNYFADGLDAERKLKKKDRAALLDWKSSRTTLLGLAVDGEGSYAGGLRLRLGPYLNCVIGSGGAATVITTLAWAFGHVSFMSRTPQSWLPEAVRVYWHDAETGTVNMVERRGKHVDPDDPSVHTQWWTLEADGWQPWIVEDEERRALRKVVTAWPAGLKLDDDIRFEEQRVQLLAAQLARGSGPLLVNQPWELFEGERLYEQVLGNPATRRRQVVWATSSPAVPIALDAEKIVVTREVDEGKRLELRCGGDLHEDEIRNALLTHFEGGEAGFRRKMAIYRL